MVTVEQYVNNINKVYKKQPKYVLGQDTFEESDCIGMVRRGLKMAGDPANGLSGTNYAARYTIKNLKKISSVSQLKLGDVVLKTADIDHPKWSLPNKYRKGGSLYNGDLNNYSHIGTVTKVNPLEITHMTSPSAKKDTKLGTWSYVGQLPQITYESEVFIVVEYATVVGGSLNVRKEKSTTSLKLASIPSGTKVAVAEHNNDWCKIAYNSCTGYVMTKFLSFEGGGDDNKVTITLSRDCALAMYEALKLSLNK